MGFFTKQLFIAASGMDPLIFLAPICLGLGVSCVAALWEFEQIRMRWRQRHQTRRLSPKSRAALRQPPPDHRS
jgi:hypothetical protein